MADSRHCQVEMGGSAREILAEYGGPERIVSPVIIAGMKLKILRRRATIVRYTCGCLLPYYSSSAPGLQFISGLVSFQCIFMVKNTSRSKSLPQVLSVAAASVYIFDRGLSYFPRSLPYLQSCWGAQHQNFHKPSLSFAPVLLQESRKTGVAFTFLAIPSPHPFLRTQQCHSQPKRHTSRFAPQTNVHFATKE